MIFLSFRPKTKNHRKTQFHLRPKPKRKRKRIPFSAEKLSMVR